MARRKPKNLYPIKDVAEANRVLGEVASLKRQLDGIDNKLNDDIDRLKVESESHAAPLHSRLDSLENGLLAFAEHNKEDLFVGKRSKALDFGSLGYRKSSEIKPKPKHTLAMILGKIKELGFSAGVRISEAVNKDELRTWPDERLELVGARRVEKDTFWYEINEQKLNEIAGA